MKANGLEKAVVERMLADSSVNIEKPSLDFEKIMVSSREFTGAGFITEFFLSEELKLLGKGVSVRWGEVGAKLSISGFGRIDAGFLIYIDDGYLNCLEGYTYGEEWPLKVEEFELYELSGDMAPE